MTAPSTWFADGWGGYVSGDVGYWALGTSDSFYGTIPVGATSCGGAFAERRQVHELPELGRRWRLHLQGLYA